MKEYEEEKKQKEDVKVYTDAMDKVEGRVQEFFTQTGQTSAPTAAGTAYLSTTYRASIADKQAFKSFVIGQSRWDLLDWKANVTATKDFAKEMKAPPAGVNLTSITKVNIRRPGQKTDDE